MSFIEKGRNTKKMLRPFSTENLSPEYNRLFFKSQELILNLMILY